VADESVPGSPPPGVTIRALEATLLSVPLREPFVIATGRIDVTRAVLVRADLDTAFLLADDPFAGGWRVSGAYIQLTGEAGLGVRPR
jgi:hypothetical protein